MRAPERLFDDVVHQAILEVVRGCQGKRIGGQIVGAFVGFLPQDRGATFRTDDAVPTVPQHRHAVADGNAKCAARATFADHNAHHRYAQSTHLAEIDCNALCLTALLRTNAGIRARGINKGHNWQLEFLGKLHLEKRLTVTLWMRAPEVAAQSLLGVAPLLVSNYQALDAADTAEASHDRRVISVTTVTMQFAPIATDHLDVIKRLRSLRMARHPDGLPRRQVAVGLTQQTVAGVLEGFNLLTDGVGIGTGLQRLYLALNLRDRLLEIKGLDGRRHAVIVADRGRR